MRWRTRKANSLFSGIGNITWPVRRIEKGIPNLFGFLFGCKVDKSIATTYGINKYAYI